jgi:hypothetical protein
MNQLRLRKENAMANRIFKNEQSLLGKLEAFYWKIWEIPGFRFIVIGGINTLVGLIVGILLRFLFEDVWGITYKWAFLKATIDIPYLIMFGLLFSYSYFMNAKFVFRTPWKLSRNFLYLLSSIPNFLLQQLFIWIFEDLLGLPYWWAYILASLCPLPIMYFINKVLVVPKKKPKKVETNL